MISFESISQIAHSENQTLKLQYKHLQITYMNTEMNPSCSGASNLAEVLYHVRSVCS